MPEVAHFATLGLGGNLGDPEAAMAQALSRLDGRADTEVIAVSGLYRTPPWGKTDQADFLNCCAAVRTRLSPQALLDACLEREREMKRVRGERFGPRTLDIDVLTYDDLRLETELLTLPHPRMVQRGFVLLPLADIAPDLIVAGRRVCDWLAEADTAGIEPLSRPSGWWKSAPIAMPGL